MGKHHGFTLIELIVVVAAVGVCLAVVVPQYGKHLERSRRSVDENTIREIAHAAEIALTNDAVYSELMDGGGIHLRVLIDTRGRSAYATTVSAGLPPTVEFLAELSALIPPGRGEHSGIPPTGKSAFHSHRYRSCYVNIDLSPQGIADIKPLVENPI